MRQSGCRDLQLGGCRDADGELLGIGLNGVGVIFNLNGEGVIPCLRRSPTDFAIVGVKLQSVREVAVRDDAPGVGLYAPGSFYFGLVFLPHHTIRQSGCGDL